MTVAGEEVPLSNPYVTDAQSAAAGRETVAERVTLAGGLSGLLWPVDGRGGARRHGR
ncbi:MAG TPA: hypothetical protein VNV62_18275 [Trebonia sp.]|jgi:hypothetical protein|nr:hypothetical protein [Trebonia sp.]